MSNLIIIHEKRITRINRKTLPILIINKAIQIILPAVLGTTSLYNCGHTNKQKMSKASKFALQLVMETAVKMYVKN